MPPSKASSPPSSIAVPFVAGFFVLAVAAAYFKLPAAAILWLGCLVASLVEPNVQPTGPKVKGVPTPIDDRQAKDIQTARYWRAARLRLLVPMDLFTPGKRIYASWVAALVAGMAMYAVPQIPSFFSVLPDKSGLVHLQNAAARDSLATLFHIANAFFSAWLVAALMATKRKVSQGSPGVHLSTLLTMMRHGDRRVLAGVFGGAIAGLLIATVLWMVVPGFSWLIQFAGVLGGALAGPAVWWSEEDLRAWRRRLGLEAEWSTIWENGKIEPAPLLEDVEDFGDAATVLTWRVMGAKSASDVISSLPKVVHSLGHDRSVYELYAPVMVQGEPQYGSVDPQRFRVALIDSQVGLNLDAAADIDPGMVRLVLECAMALGCDTARLGRLGLTDCEVITTSTSSRAAWGTRWVEVGKEAPGLKGVRDSGAIRGTMTEKLGCDVLVDHRSDALFVGHLTGDDIEFQDEGMDVTMDNLDREDFWNIRWAEGGPTKWKANQPTLVSDQRRVAKLENGAEIIREVFLIRHGTENTDYFGVDVAMTTAMDSAAMFTVAGFADRRSQRAGDRVASGIAVYYAKNGAAIPASMDRIKPAVPQPSSPTAVNAQAWVITAMVNKAFSEARLARPEITKVTCLTKPTLSRHLWEINIRLHGAVTLSDVRKKTGKIASILNVPWMRVVGDNDGIVLYAGASPDMDVLARPERDYVRLLSFDWEEAFREAGVMNNGGEVPKLDDIIPSKTNDLIATLEFELPSGKITEDKIKGSIDKLRNMTRKDFIMLKESSKGASGFALVVADSDPMPKMAPFDPELARTMKGNPFASDIENNPVCLNLGVDSPHLLFAGVSGGGKSKAAQAALCSVLLGGDDLVIIDPQKGAADFLFLKDWAIGWADTLETSVATLQALYAEMQRRIKFYRDHGKADVRDLPEDIRPKRIIVFIDEFIGLIMAESVPFNKKSTDPEIVEAREKAEAENAMRETSAGRVGKLLGEARSAGIHLVLASQSLKADSLNKVPGGSTMKNNLGRALMGNASTGDKASALRRPFDAQVMKGEVPKGRGLWEPVSLTSAIIIQVWYADQDVYLGYLEKYVPKPSEDRILDIDKFMPKEQAEGDDIIGPIPESLRAALGLSASGGFIDGEVVATTNVVSEEVIDDFTFDIPETDGELVEVPFDIPVDGGSDISQSELDDIDEAALLAQLSSDDVYDVPSDEAESDVEPVVSLAKTDQEPEDVYDVPGDEAVSTVSLTKDEFEPYNVPSDETESDVKADPEPEDVYDVSGDESEPDDKPVGYFVPKKVVADEW